MVELIATSPCAGILPVTHGAVTLSEVSAGHLTSVAPFRGRRAAVSAAMEAAHQVTFPQIGRASVAEGARCVWFGAGQAMLMGPAPDRSLDGLAALCDQSDAWAVVRIEGAGVEQVLSRLVPIDLRLAVFGMDHAARTLLGHMNVAILRVGGEAFQIMAFRSMARTLVHDLETAMAQVASRGDIAHTEG